jgi:prolyl-tRNA editing enzyme YbaK/EbsC (Cys-tRNA(Pro) deacylase)
MADVERSVDTVRAFVAPLGLEVRELSADTRTAALAAAALGTEVSAIVKSLVFWAGTEPLLVLVAGDRKVDRTRLAGELEVERVRLAPPDDVFNLTGYTVGGVPPMAHRTAMRTLLDRTLLGRPLVYAAAGAGNAIFAVSPQRLQELCKAEITDATII